MVESDRRSACEQLLREIYYEGRTADDLAKVDAFATRMQAEALREAADSFPMSYGSGGIRGWLRERASQVGAGVTREGTTP